MRKLTLLFLLAAGSVLAQDEIVEINNWRMHEGDDPAWARPDFDDSRWEASHAPSSRTGGIAKAYAERTTWYRATIAIPPGLAGRDLAIGMPMLDEVYTLYFDGVPVGQFGHWEPRPAGPVPRHKSFRIPSAFTDQTTTGRATAHIAIRRWLGGSATSYLTFYAAAVRVSHPPLLGPVSAIEDRESLHVLQGAVGDFPWLLTYLLLLGAGLACFALHRLEQRGPDYLLLGAYCLCFGVPPFLSIVLLRGSESIMVRSALPFVLNTLGFVTEAVAFLIASRICSRGRRFFEWMAAVAFVVVVFGCSSLLTQIGWTGLAFHFTAFNIPALLVAVWLLWPERKWGSILTVLSLATFGSFQIVRIFAPGFGLFNFGWLRLDSRIFGLILFVFSTLAVFYARARNEQIRHRRMEDDLSAARRMQEALLGGGIAATPGFSVDAACLPAKEVGGDFYQFLPSADGSLLVVVGDVSGKGLDAAMLVAAIIGALSDLASRVPQDVLAHLNRSVQGKTQGGFITCCCALFRDDGSVIIANAGHIPPYVNGREIEIDPGPPLGIIEGAEYEPTIIRANSATVTFLSDGVLEATDTHGEMLGFERLAALTVKPARDIANEAERWGQEDDITVVKVAYA